MKVLVTAGSRHGSTAEISQVIADELRATGAEVDVRQPELVTDMAGYDAAIIGSAVYMGSWVGVARDLLTRWEEQLRDIPTWLFSSGPLGDPPHPAGGPATMTEAAAAVGARDVAVFAGRLSRDELRLGERAITRLVHAPYGDYRDWPAIRAWSRSIADELAGEPAATSRTRNPADGLVEALTGGAS